MRHRRASGSVAGVEPVGVVDDPTLDQLKAKVATYGEDARETEVENVAIVN